MTSDSKDKFFRRQGDIGRWFGLLIFGAMTVRTAHAMPPLEAPAVALIRWALLTGLFVLFTLAYLRRPSDGALASRPVEIILPIVVVALPTFQAGGPQILYQLAEGSDTLMPAVQFLFQRVGPGMGDIASLTGMAIGEAFAVYAMLYLGRSFSIFAEARQLVTGGPYRIVRHPLYAGEMVAVWCYTLAYPTRWSLGILLLFTGLQCWRAKIEERKLTQHYPAQYADLRRQTGFMWPRLRRWSTSPKAS